MSKLEPVAKHGTVTAYFNHACRCDKCRVAAVTYLRERRHALGCVEDGCDRPYARTVDKNCYCHRHADEAQAAGLVCRACGEELFGRVPSGLCGFCEEDPDVA